MMKIERIMVATDFSAAGNRAVQEAASWASRHAAALRIVHVVPPKRWLVGLWGVDSATVAAVHRNASDALHRVADTLDPSRRWEVSTGLVTGRASKEIMRAAHAFGADLLVIGAHGARADLGGGPAPIGGTASTLVAKTAQPLLIVRRSTSNGPNVVLAAVDLRPVSAKVLDWARAGANGGSLHVLHTYEVAFAERLDAYSLASAAIDVYSAEEHSRRERDLAKLLGSADGGEVERIVVRGDAVKRVFEHIRRLKATLVVLGKHSSHKKRRTSTTFGSVCRYVSSFVQANVLVVPGP
jgi:nucleotide-binding universal stress UspA family protein